MMLTGSRGKVPAFMYRGMSTGKVTFSILLATIFIEKEYWRTTVLIDRQMQHMRERTDTELLAAARAGNKDAFGSLVERYRPMIEWIAQGMVGNASIAQELAQEAMLQAYLSLDRLRNDGRFASWLYGITLNVCRNHLRSQKMDVSSLEALMGGMFIDPSFVSEGVVDPLAIAEEHEFVQYLI